jgi:hypothetical protein
VRAARLRALQRGARVGKGGWSIALVWQAEADRGYQFVRENETNILYLGSLCYNS